MENESTILIFLDEEQKPIAEFISPVNFELDTRKIVDGKHSLKIARTVRKFLTPFVIPSFATTVPAHVHRDL